MTLDANTVWDVSHLIAFVSGAAIGAAGKYLGDRFTDQRHKSEAREEADETFSRMKRLMPELLLELANDLKGNRSHVLREVVILRSDRLRFNHDKPRIEIHETKHPSAKNQFTVLLDAGYIAVVRSDDPPIYRLTESFVQRLENEV